VDELERLGCCVDFQHRRLKNNTAADELANNAMDTKANLVSRKPGFVAARATVLDKRTVAWTAACKAFTPVLAAANDSSDALRLVRVQTGV
jgi:hypothetical protein